MARNGRCFARRSQAGAQQEGWANQQIWMGHAAVTRADTHRFSETFARGGVGQAGVEAKPFRAWIDAWEMRGLDRDATPTTSRRSSSTHPAPISATRCGSTPSAPLVLQGDGGYSRKSQREQASYYYSQPHFTAKGSLTIDDKPVEVTGQAWMDREWSSQPLASDQTGWDWFSLHFNAGEKLMLYRMRQTDGQHYGSGNWIAPDGKTEQLASADITMTPLSVHRDRGPQDSDGMAHRDSEAGAVDRMRAAERPKLDGNELSLLGRPDQLCRQPYRGRLSGNDGILELDLEITTHRHALAIAVYSILPSGVAGARQIRRQAAAYRQSDFERCFARR